MCVCARVCKCVRVCARVCVVCVRARARMHRSEGVGPDPLNTRLHRKITPHIHSKHTLMQLSDYLQEHREPDGGKAALARDLSNVT